MARNNSTPSLVLSDHAISLFQETVWQFYALNARDFAWRRTTNPYHIVVSEVMLQQTQTYRVAPKYELFVKELPDFQTLAHASVQTIYSLWQGLGYNRRALALQRLAQQVVNQHSGILPATVEELDALPGIGPATASSICAFAFNMPSVFIETNIRAVYLHHFFPGQVDITDTQLMPLIAQTVDIMNPRQWYYALMDYGVSLKQQFKNPSRRSAHHTKQSTFEGSERQLRGAVLRLLNEKVMCAYQAIKEALDNDTRVEKVLQDLVKEGFVKEANPNCYRLN